MNPSRQFLRDRQKRDSDIEDLNPQKPEPDCCDKPSIQIRDGNRVCLNCGMISQKEFVVNERRAYTIQEIQNRKRTEPRWRDLVPEQCFRTLKRILKESPLEQKSKLCFRAYLKFKIL